MPGGNGAEGFAISMPTLFEKSGAEGTYRRFKFEMQRIVARNDLPGFLLTLSQGANGEPVLHMVRRDQVSEAEQVAWQMQSAPEQAAAGAQIREETSTPPPLPLLRPLLRTLSEHGIARIRASFPGLGCLRPQGRIRRLDRPGPGA